MLKSAFLLTGLLAVTAHAQKTEVLTLKQAEDIALKHHPRLFAAMLNAEAAQKVTAETRSALLPTVSASVTGVVANDGTAVAAGALTTSSLSSRFATGFTLMQMVTDFGRTSELTRSAGLRAEAASHRASNARAQILLAVRTSYFSVLGTEAVQKAAQAALDNRRLLLRQVTALQQSAMKSTLDVTFAQVLVSEAEMALYEAQNNVQENRAALSAALGTDQVGEFSLTDQDLPPTLAGDAQRAIRQALADRPDVSAVRSERDSARQFAKAEGKLSYPTVNLMAAAGTIPIRDHVLPHDNYEAAGVTVNIPVLNGGLFSARRAEAQLRAREADKRLEDFSLQVSREVQVAWFEANTALRKMEVNTRLVDQAEKSLHLAQARYDAGLGSIVELNQAQLSETAAEIGAAGAKYDYLSRRATLDFATGAIR